MTCLNSHLLKLLCRGLLRARPCWVSQHVEAADQKLPGGSGGQGSWSQHGLHQVLDQATSSGI